MRCGCISLGDVNCDGCQRLIPYPERYLIIDEGEGKMHLCINCSLEKGYARYSEEKGQKVVTIFPEKPDDLREGLAKNE
jgi:hypothetical protein